MRLTSRLAAVLLIFAAIPARSADWPMWRCDARHGAATAQELGDDLRPQWTLQLPALKPAWPGEPRMRFDVAYEPVVAGQTLFVASPREDALLALDTRTAKLKWRFMADGPIRFAPAVSNGKVYFGSDDGCMYCLNATDGRLVWKYRAAPEERLVLGNERLISTWPVRGAPVVEDDRVYFTAGIWPFMGVFVCCLDASSGAVLWRNDGTSATYVNQPHNSPAFAGVAPQGYCALAGEILLVPGGRTAPAGFNRDTGDLIFYRLAENQKSGDYKVAANSTHFFNAGSLYQLTTGALVGGISSRVDANPYIRFVDDPTLRLNPDGNASVATDEVLCGLDKGNIVVRSVAQARTEEWADSKGTKYTNVLVPTSLDTGLQADRVWLRAGDRLVASAGNRVLLVATGGAAAKTVWQAEVPGTIESVVAADGRLFVSTLEGEIHCFGEGQAQTRRINMRREAAPRPSPLATSVVRATGVSEGYCLVLGARDPELVAALASETKLRVVAVAPDQRTATALRGKLWETGLYGPRAAVLVSEGPALRLPPYFANLVVLADGSAAALKSDMLRSAFASVRPYGGALAVRLDAAGQKALEKLLPASGLEGARLEHSGDMTVLRRAGALPGSDNWTHQYGNPANTVSASANCSAASPRAPGRTWRSSSRESPVPTPARRISPPAAKRTTRMRSTTPSTSFARTKRGTRPASTGC